MATTLSQPAEDFAGTLAGKIAVTHRLPAKRLPDGRAMLNLACGTRMDWSWNNLDFSPYARIRRHERFARFLYRIGLMSHQRRARLQNVDPQIIRWNLRKGIPFSSETFDVVYHSHFLEHIDRESGAAFLGECYRVLRVGGILRVVVPDLRWLVLRYTEALHALESGDLSRSEAHERAIYDLFDQMVRTEVSGVMEQTTWVRTLEQRIRPDAASAGELHRWMYDKHSLGRLLTRIGFRDVCDVSASASRVAGWNEFNLDTLEDGSPYKPESLYVEALR
jgi:SAM-dependent methyltransferase